MKGARHMPNSIEDSLLLSPAIGRSHNRFGSIVGCGMLKLGFGSNTVEQRLQIVTIGIGRSSRALAPCWLDNRWRRSSNSSRSN